MNKKRIIIPVIFILLFIFISFQVTAAAVQVFTGGDGEIGLDIQYISYPAIKQNTSFNYTFQVFNKTDGLVMNGDTTSCVMNLFDTSGEHSARVFVDIHERHFHANFTAGNFTEKGVMSYIIRCNTSYFGGFSSSTFRITSSGEESTEVEAIAGVGLILGIAILAFLFAFFAFKFTESERMFPIAIFFMLISLIMGVYVTQLGYLYTRDLFSSLLIDELQFKIFLGVTWGLIGVAFIGMIFLMLKTLKEFKDRKSIKQHGEGWNPKTKQYK